MTHILTILRAAHCRSTHHYFAIDALKNLKTAQAQRLANILLKHHDDYLVGAKAPDSNFKDFQNHVVHVSDNNWGGAPLKCKEWLTEARQYLDQGKWKKAAYACGVLSHYFTDPIMPLHTAQHPREQVVHRPLEWSICQSYNEILNLSNNMGYVCDFELAADNQWISKAVLAAAKVANRYYDRLVAIYDLERGVVKPREGLNEEAMKILAELFALTIGGWSQVLVRLADETTTELPQVSLTMTSVLAAVDMPLAWMVRRISDSQERRAIQALFKEYSKTGELKRHLPAEIATVNAYRISHPELGTPLKADSMSPVSSAETISDSAISLSEKRKLDEIILPGEMTTESVIEQAVETEEDVEQTTPQLQTTISGIAVENEEVESYDNVVATLQFPARDESVAVVNSSDHEAIESSSSDEDEPLFVSLSQARSRQSAATSQSKSENYNLRGTLRIAPGTMLPASEPDSTAVGYDSPVVEAPSIGPKTAKRFENIGVVTIRQLVSSSPESLVSGLATRWITVGLVQDWQDQARLVCEVPALTAYRAQLLVAVGCRTSWQLRTANPNTLSNQLQQLCQTSEGQQILRSSRVPQVEDVVKWIESSRRFARRDVA
jgi:Domain of unknown function (DUF4332)/Zinc dependent phospholipase C